MPSGKKSKAARRAARAQTPPVRTKGGPGGGQVWLSGNRLWWAGGGAAVIAVVVVAIVLASGGSGKPVHVDFAQVPGLQSGPPPWNNGVGELQNNLAALHLDALAQEALAFHIHIHDHLDVYVNGKHVSVPAGIGISTFITEVHTHVPDGVIHVESANNRPYTLGQFFGEWAVRLNANCLSSYCGHLHWWVNGKVQSGNPADLNLVDPPHKEIVIAAGKPPAHIPASYNFPAGE